MEDKKISWEKTVEWVFVRDHLPKVDFAAPLDGNHELSDALLSMDSKWILIEFKHQHKDLKSETEKYPSLDLKRAEAILRKKSGWGKKAFNEIFKKTRETESYDQYIAFEKNLNPENNEGVASRVDVLSSAQREHTNLFNDYGLKTQATMDLWEPQCFIFSQGEKFSDLKLLPYWGTWEEKNSRLDSCLEALDFSNLGRSYEQFSEYVARVATARGYFGGWAGVDPGQGEFSNVMGLVGGKAVVMTLSEFLLVYKPNRDLKEQNQPNAIKNKKNI